jgi:hypothetical protein
MVRGDGGQLAKDSTSNSGGCNAGAVKSGGRAQGCGIYSICILTVLKIFFICTAFLAKLFLTMDQKHRV